MAARTLHPGLLLLLTDGYDVEGLAAGVEALAARGHEVVLLHLLPLAVRIPGLEGELRLVDVETGAIRELTVDGPALAAYERRLALWQSELRSLLERHGGRYAPLRSELPLRRLLLEDLRHAGLLR